VWGREAGGLVLTFHLAGINNQNFLMRDEETGTFWQQISGRAVAGPMAGTQLRLIPSDELTFGLWKTEEPGGTVMEDVAGYTAEYSPEDWDVKMAKRPTVLSFPEHGFGQRDLMLGVHVGGEARAFPDDRVIAERLVKDIVGGREILLVVGPDLKSVRGFEASGDFYRITEGSESVMMDAATGSRWNFKGCAVSGPAQGQCLGRVEVIADYWFDWREYNPGTSVYLK
jgi:hypothetical protein